MGGDVIGIDDPLTDILGPLRLFNEKASALQRTRFVQYAHMSASVKYTPGEVEVNLNVPDEEATSAFILAFRFFIMEKEASSFKSMARTYQALPISDELKNEFLTLRNGLNALLDSNSNVKIEGFTRRDIIWTVIYGELAHSDPQKRKQINEWKKDAVVWAMVQIIFNTSLVDILDYIVAVANLNTKVIEEIAKRKP